jgi:hypothetical protein
MMDYKMMNCKKYQNENESDVNNNSGVVLSHPSPCSVVHHPSTSPRINSANWVASHELRATCDAIIAGHPVVACHLWQRLLLLMRIMGGGQAVSN